MNHYQGAGINCGCFISSFVSCVVSCSFTVSFSCMFAFSCVWMFETRLIVRRHLVFVSQECLQPRTQREFTPPSITFFSRASGIFSFFLSARGGIGSRFRRCFLSCRLLRTFSPKLSRCKADTLTQFGCRLWMFSRTVIIL